MTPEQLDEARAREAFRIHRETPEGKEAFPFDSYAAAHTRPIGLIAARLAREGWKPVDPDLIEAREIVAKWWENPPSHYRNVFDPESFRRGERDTFPEVTQTLAAIKRGRELERVTIQNFENMVKR